MLAQAAGLRVSVHLTCLVVSSKAKSSDRCSCVMPGARLARALHKPGHTAWKWSSRHASWQPWRSLELLLLLVLLSLLLGCEGLASAICCSSCTMPARRQLEGIVSFVTFGWSANAAAAQAGSCCCAEPLSSQLQQTSWKSTEHVLRFAACLKWLQVCLKLSRVPPDRCCEMRASTCSGRVSKAERGSSTEFFMDYSSK